MANNYIFVHLHNNQFQGDSGGPLVAPEKNGNRRYFLLGLSSSGIGKCGGGVPDLFTKVSHYREWIMENLI